MNDLTSARLAAIKKIYDYYIVEDKPFGYDPEKGCIYYDPKTGNRCGIGLLLGDKAKDFAGVDSIVYHLMTSANRISPADLGGIDAEFASALQGCHDDCVDREDAKENLKRNLYNTCLNFNLSVPDYLRKLN